MNISWPLGQQDRSDERDKTIEEWKRKKKEDKKKENENEKSLDPFPSKISWNFKHLRPSISNIQETKSTLPSPESGSIKAFTPFTVHTAFGIEGDLVPSLAGAFHVTAYFERYGGGTEPEFGPVTIPLSSAETSSKNTKDFKVDIPIPTGLSRGVYELIVLITYTDEHGAPGPIAGFSDQEVFIEIL